MFRKILLIFSYLIALSSCNFGKTVGLTRSNYDTFLKLSVTIENVNGHNQINLKCNRKSSEFTIVGFCYFCVRVDYSYFGRKDLKPDGQSYELFDLTLNESGYGKGKTYNKMLSAETECNYLKILRIEPTGRDAVFGNVKIGNKSNVNLTNSVFTVNFVNYDGTTLYSDKVNLNNSARYEGKTPIKKNQSYRYYSFTGWDRELNNIYYNFTTIALYDVKYDYNDLEYTNGQFSYSKITGGYAIKCSYGYVIDNDDENTANKKLVMPSLYQGEKIIQIEKQAVTRDQFGYDIKTIQFPKYLKTINELAFSNHRSLSEINLPEGLETIGRRAFYGSTFLRKVNLPSTLKRIEEMAFEYIGAGGPGEEAPAMTVTIPKSVQYIGKHIFYCEHLGVSTFYCYKTNYISAWSNEWNLRSGLYTSNKVYHNIVWIE